MHIGSFQTPPDVNSFFKNYPNFTIPTYRSSRLADRIALLRTFAQSKLIYLALVIALPMHLLHAIQRASLNFIFKRPALHESRVKGSLPSSWIATLSSLGGLGLQPWPLFIRKYRTRLAHKLLL